MVRADLDSQMGHSTVGGLKEARCMGGASTYGPIRDIGSRDNINPTFVMEMGPIITARIDPKRGSGRQATFRFNDIVPSSCFVTHHPIIPPIKTTQA